MTSGIRPLKRFSQNFLQDTNIARKMVEAMRIRPGDYVVEIGPGEGALTRLLLETTELAGLVAIEVDDRLILGLQEQFGGDHRFRCLHADFLKTDIRSLRKGDDRIRFVGNLPYGITSPILFHLLDHYQDVRDAVFMVQKEVGERLASAPNCKAYGIPSVLFQAVAEVECKFIVPPTVFRPTPEVDSIVLGIAFYEQPKYAVNDWNTFRSMVRTAFNQRRKMLRKSMKSWELTRAQGIFDLTRRPENLTVQEWVAFSNTIIKL